MLEAVAKIMHGLCGREIVSSGKLVIHQRRPVSKKQNASMQVNNMGVLKGDGEVGGDGRYSVSVITLNAYVLIVAHPRLIWQ